MCVSCHCRNGVTSLMVGQGPRVQKGRNEGSEDDKKKIKGKKRIGPVGSKDRGESHEILRERHTGITAISNYFKRKETSSQRAGYFTRVARMSIGRGPLTAAMAG